jgi:hypothetical protein
MSIFNRIGCKDIDLRILQNLTDRDLLSIMLVNKHAYQLLTTPTVWMTRTFDLFQNTKPSQFIVSFQQQYSKTWKEYYVSLIRTLKHLFPTFQAAIATDQNRDDIVHLLQFHKNAQPIVKTVPQRENGDIQCVVSRKFEKV